MRSNLHLEKRPKHGRREKPGLGARHSCLFIRIREAVVHRYYWDRVQDDVVTYIQRCHNCQMNRVSLKVSTELRPIRPPHEPFSMYGIDLISLPITPRKNRYAVVAVDYFSKFPIAKAIPGKSSALIAEFLITDVISVFGMPKVIISDQGTEFAGVTKELADRMGIDRRVSTPYHSQTNGLVERMNRTIKDLLVKSLEKRVDWHIQLPLILMSIRSHTTRATGYSSFELVTGRKMIWPQDIELYRQENDDFRFTEDDIDVFESQEKALHEERLKRLEELANVRKKARENIINEQSKYKARYDQLHNPQCYEVGDKVTLQNDRKLSRKGDVLEANRSGPFVIKEVSKSKKTVVLDDCKHHVATCFFCFFVYYYQLLHGFYGTHFTFADKIFDSTEQFHHF
ncbi:hypothetical protein QR680_009293 [Steinernema hermaphroditum]|uniref:RNA-directed DNA polymerase n=1 Tax=Steinernema hermaphroditum TaxID=289476 RepID=A0AA39M959_9BILA|nr:hypothetical protein QR680_009293 [Steinernema hermaphroditum]